MTMFAGPLNEENKEIEKILIDLKSNVDEIRLVSVVHDTGLPIVFTSNEGNETKIAAITAAILSLAETTITEISLGRFNQIYVQGTQGYFLITRIDGKTLLVVATTEHIKLGLLFLESQRTRDKIKEIVQKYQN